MTRKAAQQQRRTREREARRPPQPAALRETQFARVDLLIRQTHESVKALFHKMHALELAVMKSNVLFLRLLDDPETRQHAEAVAKEFGVGPTSTVKLQPK